MITVGLVGYGGIGRMHLANLRQLSGVQVTHIVDLRQEAFAGATAINLGTTDGGSLAEIRCHTDYAAMLSDPAVQVVLICTPTPCHAAQTQQALRAGKHVICEKPLALDPALVREMVSTAQDCGKMFFGAFCIRFWPEYEVLYQAVHDQRYGALLGIEFRRLSAPPRWTWDNWMLDGRRSGGALGDLHIHDLDFAVHLLGRPHRVYASGRTVWSGEPDIVFTTLSYDGIVVSCHGTTALAGGFSMQYRAFFEQGVLEYGKRREQPLVFLPYDNGQEVPIATEARTGHQKELAVFMEAIARNEPLAELSYDSMVLSAQVQAAARRSIALNAPVDL